MAEDFKAPQVYQEAADIDEIEDEEEMRRAGLKNPPDACGREEDRFGK